MKYLTFDIECCDGKHICEFGYVVYNEDFQVLERNCILINPEHKFKLSGREHESDISLAFSKEEYFNSPTFDVCYERIRKILSAEYDLIIGFALQNDCGFLATAYGLYNKEPIRFEFVDFQKMYGAYVKRTKGISVENFVKELELVDITLHKSDDDSYAVMRALETISKRENKKLPQTIEYLRKLSKTYRREVAKERNETLLEKLSSGNKRAQTEYLKRFVSRLNVNPESENIFFKEKKVCISGEYQQDHFNEFLSLIKFLYDNGSEYTGRASDCDIFILGNCSDEDKRLQVVKNAIDEEKKDIQIMSLLDALSRLNITEKDLSLNEYVGGSRRNTKGYYEGQASITIGEYLKVKEND